MISAIVAVDKNYGIGYNNKLLCNLTEDLKHFKNLTTNNIVVMGRKTWDSLPMKPLPNRINVVITNSVKDNGIALNNGVIFATLDLLKKYIEEIGEKYNIFVIGGSQIYKELVSYCDYIHLTRIHKSFDNVDTYFPEIKENEWRLLDVEPTITQGDIKYQFEIYKKIKGEEYNDCISRRIC